MAKGKQQSAAERRDKQRQQRSQRLQGAQDRIQPMRSANRKGPKARRRSWKQSYMVGIVLVLIVGIIVAFVVISRVESSVPPPALASSQVVKAVTQVDPNILSVAGTGSLQNPFKPIQGSPKPLVGPTGKPEILYIGAEWCPYCAAQRWPLVIALSRFGTFSQLYQITSSSADVFPNTPTFTFDPKLYKGPVYTSQYIDFVAVEKEGNVPDNNGVYPTLQTLTAEQQQLRTKYDAPPYIDAAHVGSIPFLDIANKYVGIGLAPGKTAQQAGYSAQDLAGMQWTAIANALSDTKSTISQHILGSANFITAGLCIATNQQPASVCSTDVIQTIEKTFTKATASVNTTNIALNGALEADLRRYAW